MLPCLVIYHPRSDSLHGAGSTNKRDTKDLAGSIINPPFLLLSPPSFPLFDSDLAAARLTVLNHTGDLQNPEFVRAGSLLLAARAGSTASESELLACGMTEDEFDDLQMKWSSMSSFSHESKSSCDSVCEQ